MLLGVSDVTLSVRHQMDELMQLYRSTTSILQEMIMQKHPSMSFSGWVRLNVYGTPNTTTSFRPALVKEEHLPCFTSFYV